MTQVQQTEPDYPLSQIYFYLTKGCNLRCRHCWIAPKFQGPDRTYPSLDLDLFKSIITQAKPLGLSSVKLTGGEPLIHPRIVEILEYLQAEDLGVSVETNGVACTPEIASKLASCKNPFVSVSLDGASAETHEWVRGVPACFEAALTGIRNLMSAGLRPQLIMSVMRRNKDEMEPFVRLAESLGAGSVKFNLVQPTARGEQMHRSGETLSIQELVELGRWVESELAATAKVSIFYSHPAAFRPLGKMFGEQGSGCDVCGIFGILGVLGDGTYALCGIGETVPALVFGHANVDKLETVWNDNPVLQEIRQGLPGRLEGICADCVMKQYCLGSCIAQNYYRSKSLWAPYWFCDEAHQEGLFPQTRTLLKPSRYSHSPK